MDNEVLTGQVRRAARRQAGGRPLRLQTERGDVSCLYHAGKPGAGAVIWVGGFDGGFDGPADGIYATLAEDLSRTALAPSASAIAFWAAPATSKKPSTMCWPASLS